MIDDEAVTSEDDWGRLMGIGAPIVMLVDRMETMPADFTGTVLRKPLLGGRLVEAVTRALSPKLPSK